MNSKRTKTCQSCKYWDLSDGITDTDGVMIRECTSPSWYGKYEQRSTNSCKYWEGREEETPMKKEKTCECCNHWKKGCCYHDDHVWTTTRSCTCEYWECEKEMKEKGEILTCLDCKHLWSDAKWADHRMFDLNVSDNKHGCDCHNNGFKSLEIRLCTHFVLKEKEKEMKNHEFKPGDRVVIDVEGKDRTESPTISDEMMKMHGEEHVIEKKTHGEWYVLECTRRPWGWIPKWLRASKIMIKGDEEEMREKEPTCTTCEEEEKGQQPFERALKIYTAELAKEAKQAAEVLKIESALETKHLKIVDNILTEAEYLVDLNNGYKQLSGKDLVRKGFRFGRNGFKYRGDPDLWDDPYVKFRKHKGHKRSLEIGTGSFPDKAVCFKNGDRATYCTAGILTKALRVIEGAIKQ